MNAVEAARQVSVLLTVIGAKAHDTLRKLFAPTHPCTKSFDELISALKQYFDLKPLVTGERFHFYLRSQKADESVADFLTALRKLI